MRSHKRQAGFSLIEMMVSVAVLGIISAQLFVVFGNQKKVYASSERALDAQEQARMTLDLISFDTRMAGFMVPAYTALSSVDGGAADADRFCVSDPSFADLAGSTGLMNGFTGAPVGFFVNDYVQLASLDIDGNGSADFRGPDTPGGGNGGGIIIANDQQTYCARITEIEILSPTNYRIHFDDHADLLNSISGGAMGLAAVPAVIYELDQDKRELHRNGVLLATDIEDFETEYWVDSDGVNLADPNSHPDGIEQPDQEFPVNNLGDPDPPIGALQAMNSAIRKVRVTVLARTTREDDDTSAAGARDFARPKVANRDASVDPDRYRRRAYSVSIFPRNIKGVQVQGE
jgi:prepilin-type N-terminal cleavage/methylation domain-containing protein